MRFAYIWGRPPRPPPPAPDRPVLWMALSGPLGPLMASPAPPPVFCCVHDRRRRAGGFLWGNHATGTRSMRLPRPAPCVLLLPKLLDVLYAVFCWKKNARGRGFLRERRYLQGIFNWTSRRWMSWTKMHQIRNPRTCSGEDSVPSGKTALTRRTVGSGGGEGAGWTVDATINIYIYILLCDVVLGEIIMQPYFLTCFSNSVINDASLFCFNIWNDLNSYSTILHFVCYIKLNSIIMLIIYSVRHLIVYDML